MPRRQLQVFGKRVIFPKSLPHLTHAGKIELGISDFSIMHYLNNKVYEYNNDLTYLSSFL